MQEMEVVREPADFVSKKLNFYDFSLSDGGKGILGYNLSLTDAGKYLDRIPCFSCMFGQRKVLTRLLQSLEISNQTTEKPCTSSRTTVRETTVIFSTRRTAHS